MRKFSKNISGKDLIKILEKDYGFKIVRIQGSHHILRNEKGFGSCIPIHANKPLKIGLLRKILKDCNIFPSEIFGSKSIKKDLVN